MVVTLVTGGCVALAILAFVVIALAALRRAPGQVPEVLAGLSHMISSLSLLRRRPEATLPPGPTDGSSAEPAET